MKLTNEQIQAILDGAPDEKFELSHVDSLGFYHINDGHDLNDLREILELRQEVERLKADLKIVMPVIDELAQGAVEPSDIYADDLQDWLIKAGVLKVVPFDPRLHYDYTHETQDGQDWITWSDWYEKTKERGV